MAYNEDTALRIRELLAGELEVSEKKMFGGLSFMVSGNMACGVLKDDLVVRVGPDAHNDAMTRPHTRPMDFTGRPTKGMVYVGPAGFESPEDLKSWVDSGLRFARSLPPKY